MTDRLVWLLDIQKSRTNPTLGNTWPCSNTFIEFPRLSVSLWEVAGVGSEAVPAAVTHPPSPPRCCCSALTSPENISRQAWQLFLVWRTHLCLLEVSRLEQAFYKSLRNLQSAGGAG